MTSPSSPISPARPPFPRAALLGLSLTCVACAGPPSVPPVDAGTASDAHHTAHAADANATLDGGVPDGAVSPDAARVIEGACFEGPTRIASSVAAPGARAHVRPLDLAAFAHGFVIAISDNAAEADTLVVTDRSGNVIAREPAPLLTERVVVVGSSALVFGGYQVQRMDLGPTGIVRRYPGQYVGGIFARHEGLRALEAQADGTLRALTHHYLEAEARSVLRLSIITLDDAVEPGLVQRIDDLAAIDGLTPFDDRFFLRGDHLRIVTGGRELDGEQAEQRGELDDRVHGHRGGVLEGVADGVADDGGRVQRGALLLELDLDDLLGVVPGAAGVGHEERLEEAEEGDRDEVADEEVGTRRTRRRACAKKTSRKMLNMPFCAYCVQISTTFLRVLDGAFSAPSSLMFALMNSTAR
jgi:hypothetical protein